MFEETPDYGEAHVQPSAGSPGPRHRGGGIPAPRSGLGRAPAAAREVAADDDSQLAAWALLSETDRRPGVEWGVLWPDGRITPVDDERSARVLAGRLPDCVPTCRLVGAWGPV